MQAAPLNRLILLVLAVGAGGCAPAGTQSLAPLVSNPPACINVTRPFPSGTVLTSQWIVDSPPDHHTYDLTGVTSTAYPPPSQRNTSVFDLGGGHAPSKTCFEGGVLKGTVSKHRTWDYYHDRYNAACLKLTAKDWMRVRHLRCNGVEDGFRPKETTGNANNVVMFVSDTYFTQVRDDCIENDGTIGGVLYDSLWEQCFTGVSERPSTTMGSWTSPAGETLTLDHMLIGLYETRTASGIGENALFKWSASANDLVIKCSTFKVDAVSINGSATMEIPTGTVVDDAACPHHPSTIVWLGGGKYPAATAGMRVTSHLGVWKRAVARWKCAHGYGSCH
jgi:hypothetical protein